MSVAALEQHRRDLARLWAAASVDVRTAALAVRKLDVADAREMLKIALPDLMDPFMGAASDLSAVLLEELYGIVANVPAGQYLPSAGKIDGAARWAVTPMVDPTLESTVVSRVAGTAERMLYDSARLTVERGVISNYFARRNRRYGNITRDESGRRVRFQRLPRATACDFCQMLAGRGAVYLTEASAGGVVGRGVDLSQNFNADGSQRLFGNRMAGGVKARGAAKLGSNYHDACRCLVQPVFQGTEVADYATEIQQKYSQKFAAAYATGQGELDSDEAVMARWRKLQHK
ncbi:hypothetical protein ACFSWE_08585 [Leucobacter albus]|uniref:Minor capsid protein 2 n=1 Tax=Leucobacter albus TaxID=272210 RepID=A0ABW3TR75_9MICO